MIALLLIASTTAELMDPWMTFTRAPAFDRRVTIVDVGTLSSSPEWHYWFRRTVRTKNASQVWWTDTKRCPAARSVLVAANKVPPPNIDVPGVEGPTSKGEIVIAGDGVSYSLSSSSSYPPEHVGNQIRFNSNLDTPLAAWVDQSLRTLEACWSKEPPMKV